jgi:hydrogenase nickel incorporation protein HypA/HybF
MHELSIAYEINSIVDQYVKAEEKKLIKSVRIRVGKLQNILPDSLIFCFEAINSSGDSAGPKLEIEQVPITIECDECGSVNEVEDYTFNCINCGSTDIRLITGNELAVKEIELFDEDKKEIQN